MKSRTLPRIYTDFEKKISLPFPSNRDKNLEFETKNNYEDFIKKNILKFMPVSYLEGFDEVENYCKKIKVESETNYLCSRRQM